MEIFVAHIKLNEIEKWLTSIFEKVSKPIDAGNSIVFKCNKNDERIPVIVTENIEETNFTGIWFNTEIPICDSLESLAKKASIELSTTVRYEKDGAPVEFYEIRNSEIKEINWQ